MAVVFAVVGAGAVIGVINESYSDYSDHSDYSNYGNYSNYSDAAERRRRRVAAKEDEIKQGVHEVNEYKITRVNGYLRKQKLISAPGTTVELYEVKNDGNGKIDSEEWNAISKETKCIQQEIDKIDETIAAIDKILEDKK